MNEELNPAARDMVVAVNNLIGATKGLVSDGADIDDIVSLITVQTITPELRAAMLLAACLGKDEFPDDFTEQPSVSAKKALIDVSALLDNPRGQLAYNSIVFITRNIPREVL